MVVLALELKKSISGAAGDKTLLCSLALLLPSNFSF